MSARLEQQYPEENKDIGVLVLGLRDELSERARLLVLALCGAALCILLLACANLASLFLARGAHRARELAVRSALGAGRERLVRQLVTESLGIAFVGGIVGSRGRRRGRASARAARPQHAADRGARVAGPARARRSPLAFVLAHRPRVRRSRPRCARGGATRSTRCAAARGRRADARSGCAPRSSSSRSRRRSCCSSRRGC